MEAGTRPLTVIVMGPAGAGKTTIGQALASELGWPFLDADDFHSPESVERMRSGLSLTDAARQPWLARVRLAIDEVHAQGRSSVVACSALKQRYRDLLADGLPDVQWVYLEAPAGLLAARLASREGHYAGPALLAGQLADLEPPGNALTIPAALPVPAIVARIRAAIRP